MKKQNKKICDECGLIHLEESKVRKPISKKEIKEIISFLRKNGLSNEKIKKRLGINGWSNEKIKKILGINILNKSKLKGGLQNGN